MVTIIHLVEYYDSVGGLKTHINHLIKQCDKFGIRTIIIALQSRNQSGWDQSNPDLLWIDKEVDVSLGPEYSIFEMKVFEIYRLINHIKVDLVHAHCNYGYSIGVPLAHSLRCPSVLTLHGCYPLFPLAKCMDCTIAKASVFCEACSNLSAEEYLPYKLYFLQHGITLRAADRVIALNKETLNICVSRYHISETKLRIINHWVEIPEETVRITCRKIKRENHRVKEDNQVLLWVGTNRPHKRFDIVVHTFQKLAEKYSNISLWITGITQEVFERETIGICDKILNRMNCMGIVDNTELAQLYAGSDILLFPSIWESVSYILLEAMAYKLPSIAFSGLSNADFLFNHQNVHLVPFRDKDAFIDATEHLLLHPEYRKDLGMNAHKYIQEHHNDEQCYSYLMEEYNKAISEYKLFI